MAKPVESMPAGHQAPTIPPGRDDKPASKLNVKALIKYASVGAVVYLAVLVALLVIGGNHLGDDLRAWAYALPVVALLPAAYITVKRQQSLERQHDLAADIEERRRLEADDIVKRGTEAAFRARYSEAATLIG